MQDDLRHRDPSTPLITPALPSIGSKAYGSKRFSVLQGSEAKY